MATTTYIQSKALFDDLKGAKGIVSWQVGKIANALLEKAQEEQPGNVSLGAIDPLRPDQDERYIADMQADDVRAVVGQIATATYTGPSIA